MTDIPLTRRGFLVLASKLGGASLAAISAARFVDQKIALATSSLTPRGSGGASYLRELRDVRLVNPPSDSDILYFDPTLKLWTSGTVGKAIQTGTFTATIATGTSGISVNTSFATPFTSGVTPRIFLVTRVAGAIAYPRPKQYLFIRDAEGFSFTSTSAVTELLDAGGNGITRTRIQFDMTALLQGRLIVNITAAAQSFPFVPVLQLQQSSDGGATWSNVASMVLPLDILGQGFTAFIAVQAQQNTDRMYRFVNSGGDDVTVVTINYLAWEITAQESVLPVASITARTNTQFTTLVQRTIGILSATTYTFDYLAFAP